MSVRPEIAANLLDLQSKLGDDLTSVLDEQPASSDLPSAEVRRSVALQHLGGLHAGGTLPLEVGSYRLGPARGSVVLDAGTPGEPRFGLTVDPAGPITLYPPPSGVTLDAVGVDQPAPVGVGQVIASGLDRFVLAPRKLSRRRGAGGGDEPTAPMPTPAKGRGVDQAILDWVRDARNRDGQLRRTMLAHPAEMHRRIEQGEGFEAAPGHPTFGVAAVAIADVPYELPAETSAANRATQQELVAFDVLPGVPIGIDFTRHSLAVVGPRPAGRAVATWVALSLAAQSTPEHLGVALRVRSNPSMWSCLEGLPHAQRLEPAPLQITVVDESRPVDLPEQGAIVLLESGTEPPAGVDATLSIEPEAATLVQRAVGRRDDAVSPIGLSAALGLEWALVMTEQLNPGGNRQ